MAKISFTKPFPVIEVAKGENLMQALIKNGLPVASSCYGDGVCGKCRLEILSGKENLSPINDNEKLVRERLNLAKEVRLSCQTTVEGDVTVDATYW